MKNYLASSIHKDLKNVFKLSLEAEKEVLSDIIEPFEFYRCQGRVQMLRDFIEELEDGLKEYIES